METYLEIFFKIILLLNSVIYVSFTHVLIEMLFTITTCCFIIFYKDSTSNYIVLMVCILFQAINCCKISMCI